jgi:glycosyltransferase involved in cell wall biosynthesis
MSGEPLVSIVLPVYNGARLVRKSVESCLTQTYGNIELIVVDDGSKDNTVPIVKSITDPRLKLICHETNRKLPGALNTGFARSSGAYLTWTSDDNYYAPSAIAEMASFLETHPDTDLVFTNHYEINECGEVIAEIKAGPFEKMTQWCCGTGGFLYRRCVYEKLGGYDERFPLAQDYDYWLRAYFNFRLGHLDRFLYYTLVHPGQMTSRFNIALLEETLAVKRKILGADYRHNRTELSRAHLYEASRFLFERNHRAAAARALLRAIAFRPVCLTEYQVLVMLADVCIGQNAFGFLQRIKRAIRQTASDHF